MNTKTSLKMIALSLGLPRSSDGLFPRPVKSVNRLASWGLGCVLAAGLVCAGPHAEARNPSIDWEALRPPPTAGRSDGFVHSINGGQYSEKLTDKTPEIMHKAETAIGSTLPLIFEMNKLGIPFSKTGADLKQGAGSSTYIGCGILLTAAHNVVVNPDPKNRFWMMRSRDVYTDADKEGDDVLRLLKPVMDFRVHPKFLEKVKERRNQISDSDSFLDFVGTHDEFVGIDLALLKMDEAAVEGLKPMPIASEQYIAALSRSSGSPITLAGFGAEEIGSKFSGVLKFADVRVAAPAIQPAANEALNPGIVRRETGVALGGDSGGSAFVTQKLSGSYSSALVGAFVAYFEDKQRNKIAYLAGPNRGALRQMYTELTRGKKCVNPF